MATPLMILSPKLILNFSARSWRRTILGSGQISAILGKSRWSTKTEESCSAKKDAEGWSSINYTEYCNRTLFNQASSPLLTTIPSPNPLKTRKRIKSFPINHPKINRSTHFNRHTTRRRNTRTWWWHRTRCWESRSSSPSSTCSRRIRTLAFPTNSTTTTARTTQLGCSKTKKGLNCLIWRHTRNVRWSLIWSSWPSKIGSTKNGIYVE